MTFDWAILAPNERLSVPFRVDLIWFVLHLGFNCRGIKTSNLMFRRFAAVETHHDFVMKQGLKKLATPKGNGQLGENCPTSKASKNSLTLEWPCVVRTCVVRLTSQVCEGAGNTLGRMLALGVHFDQEPEGSEE